MENILKRKARIYRLKNGKPLSHDTVRQLFSIRGKDLSRIETLSDAVFAFTISLLIMSLEVPQTFEELQLILKSFLPFVATVLLVFLFWYQQNRFFRYYGLNDLTVIILNIALLILILFYAYPLKFLFSLLIGMITHIDFFHKATARGEAVLTAEQFPQVVMVYSAGYAAIWLVFYRLYKHAWKLRNNLQLNALELGDIKKQLRGAFMNMMIGLTAFVFAWLDLPALGGLCFALVLPILLVNN
ncbi:MAG: TMEM175 family protein [Bacteroidota bacterium]